MRQAGMGLGSSSRGRRAIGGLRSFQVAGGAGDVSMKRPRSLLERLIFDCQNLIFLGSKPKRFRDPR